MTNAQKKNDWKARTQVWKNVTSAQVIIFFPFSDNKCFVLKFVLGSVDIIRSLTPVLRKVWCNVIRIQHIFNNPLRFLGLLVLFIWKSIYTRVCMCWCNLIFSEQVNRGLSPCFLSSCWTTTWRPESSGCGMGWLPWLFPSAAHQSGGFCSLSTGRECVLFFR